MDLKNTPLLERHKGLSAKMAPFGGWLMPIQYKGILEEHNWTRTNVSIFDICHMGEFIIEGSPDAAGLDRICTHDFSGMPLNSCKYGFMLNDNAGIIDDLIVYKLGDNKWMLVVNAATTEKDRNHILGNLKDKDAFKDISAETAKLDVQGPGSLEIIRSIAGEKIEKLSYYEFSVFKILQEDAIISRTGYTGELGFEIYINMKDALKIWDMITSKPDVRPAGLGARDTLRLEMGYVLYGQDIDDNISPVEAGMDRFIDFDKDFIGKDALIMKKGLHDRKLTYFECVSRRSPRHNYKILKDDQEIGVVTSGSYSPSLSRGIGMGYIEKIHDKPGTKINVVSKNVNIDAEISKRPFYKKGTARR